MKKVIFLVLIMLSMLESRSQGGWQNIYPTSNGSQNGDGIHAVRQTADGGYILAGIMANNLSNHKNLVVKVNDLGNIQWSAHYAVGDPSWATNIEIADDGGYYVEGMRFNLVTFKNEVYIQKLDALGNELWINFYSTLNVATKGSKTADGGYVTFCYDLSSSGSNDSLGIIRLDGSGNTLLLRKYHNGYGIPHSVIETAAGDFLVEGFSSNKAFLCKFNSAGDSLWHATYGLNSIHPEYIGKVIELPDGSYSVCSNGAPSGGGPAAQHRVYLFKTDASGTLLWEQYYGQPGDVGTDVSLTSDGGYILAGIQNINQNNKVLIIRTDGNGNQQWIKSYGGYGSGTFKAYSVRPCTDGGFIVGGAQVSQFYTREHMYLIKTDSLGEIYSNTIQGLVYHDANSNCQADSGEFRFANRVITISGSQTHYTSTDSNGFYSTRVDTGNYLVSLQPAPSGIYWENAPCSPDTLAISIPNQLSTVDTSFALNALALCPLLEVHLSVVFLRRCFTNTYVITYCNQGTVAESNAYIDFSPDPFLVIDTASIPVPYIATGLNQYRLFIGNLAIGACGSLAIPVLVSCASTLGQTHCSEAAIGPVSTCLLPAWIGAVVGTNATCLNDTIVFTLSNSGNSASSNLNFLVYKDTLLYDQGGFSLNTGGTITLSYPSDNGATFTLIAQQEFGYPELLGDSLVSVSIEGCGGSPTTGIVTQFGLYDGSPYVDIDCRPNIGSYDPNDKTGFPAGFGNQHFILPETELTYHIRFQNTGTDTAFTVVIRDTLSEYLDVSSLQFMASSHACTWSVHGSDVPVIDFVFNSILLPDSNTNEPASHGFVTFRIRQKEENPLGTLIENTAGIYFDFNEPIITNTTSHEVNNLFIPPLVTTARTYVAEANSLLIYPNPAGDVVFFNPNGSGQKGFFSVRMYNSSGQLMLHESFQEGIHKIDTKQVPSGLVFYVVEQPSGWRKTGKLIIRH